jgi:hypothetical protein
LVSGWNASQLAWQNEGLVTSRSLCGFEVNSQLVSVPIDFFSLSAPWKQREILIQK